MELDIDTAAVRLARAARQYGRAADDAALQRQDLVAYSREVNARLTALEAAAVAYAAATEGTTRPPRRHRAQSLVEFALVLPLLLFTIGAGFDVLWWTYRDGLVTHATAYGAQLAAAGRPDAEVVNGVTALGQQVLRPQDVTITPCGSRSVGATATVTAAYVVRPLFPVSMWAWQWVHPSGQPVSHSVSLGVQTPCA